MTSPLSRLIFVSALLTSVAVGGCLTMTEIAKMPGLTETRPTGPKGQKCYNQCSQANAACREMCPKVVGICHDDCTTDTKFCLVDCPELDNLLIDENKK